MTDRQGNYMDGIKALGLTPWLGTLFPNAVPAAAPVEQFTPCVGRWSSGAVVVGWGNGCLSDWMRDFDRPVTWIIPVQECGAVAAALADLPLALFQRPNHRWMFAATNDDAATFFRGVHGAFYTDATTAGPYWMAGADLVADHPVDPAIAIPRKQMADATSLAKYDILDGLGNSIDDTWTGVKYLLRQGPRIVTDRSLESIRDIGKGMECVCLASGPSGKQHFLSLRNDERCLIVADSILEGALEAGLRPSYVCCIERDPPILEMLKRCADKTDAWLVCAPYVMPEVADLFQGRVIWWSHLDEVVQWTGARLLSNPGRSSGTMTVAAAGVMGFDHAWLVGHDLAYGPGGESYNESVSPVSAKIDAELIPGGAEAQFESSNPQMRSCRVMGNNGKEITSRALWRQFRADIEALQSLFPGTKWHNVCGRGRAGALVRGAALEESLPTWTGDSPAPLPPADRPDDLAAYQRRVMELRHDIPLLRALFSRSVGETRLLIGKGCRSLGANATFWSHLFRSAERGCNAALAHNLRFARTVEEAMEEKRIAITAMMKVVNGALNKYEKEIKEASSWAK